MRIHANARTCPNSRKLLVTRIEEENWSLMAAAEAAGISERSARKWLGRWRAEGETGLLDRSSAPRRVPSRLPADRLQAVEALRRLRMTAAEIAEILGMALSTVSRWLARIGLGKRSRLAPPEPPNRYERKRPGELIHVDVKKLGRISRKGAGHRVTGNRKSQVKTIGGLGVTGWEFVHVCVDDAVHAETCAELSMRHIFTRPYRPQTNGKAERFIQTLTNRWAYGAIYGSSVERTAALPGWVDHYNFRRRHGSLGHKAPAARLAELEQRAE
jgi:transposase